MSLLLLLPPILSLLLLAAHSMRLGTPILMAIPVLTLILLALPRRWVARWTQILLILGAFEWIRVMSSYIATRQDLGVAWIRLALILGTVALVTMLSALVFESQRLRQRYRRG